MFASTGTSIGERNVAAVKKELRRLGVALMGEDTGSNYGRTMEFHPADGSVTLKSVIHGEKSL